MNEVYGGVAFFVCAVVWLAFGGYSYARSMQSGAVNRSNGGAALGFCLLLAPFAFGFSLVVDAKSKPPQPKQTIPHT